MRLPAAYVAEHTHLAYASTAYGVQGITAPESHTILTDAMSGAAVYVGMTRGADENVLHFIAENTAEARAQFIDAIERDRADRGLTAATQQAAEAVWGLVDDGPVKIANTEIAALTQQAAHAEQRAALWRQAADALTELHARRRDEGDQAVQAADTAAQQLEWVRAEVAAPLTEPRHHRTPHRANARPRRGAAVDESGGSRPAGTRMPLRGSSASPALGSTPTRAWPKRPSNMRPQRTPCATRCSPTTCRACASTLASSASRQ